MFHCLHRPFAQNISDKLRCFSKSAFLIRHQQLETVASAVVGVATEIAPRPFQIIEPESVRTAAHRARPMFVAEAVFLDTSGHKDFGPVVRG
jgi:hypothetical protein